MSIKKIHRNKIVIVDRIILNGSRIVKNTPNSEDLPFGDYSIKNLEKDYKTYKDLAFLDLSSEFQTKSNTQEEIFVLTNQKELCLNTNSVINEEDNFILNKKKLRDLLSKDFEVDNALKNLYIGMNTEKFISKKK
jgi:hypothetical protein